MLESWSGKNTLLQFYSLINSKDALIVDEVSCDKWHFVRAVFVEGGNFKVVRKALESDSLACRVSYFFHKYFSDM